MTGDWWREGVLYQIYPRPFADSNGDGVGDLQGITERLEHLAWLGADGIWLSPVTPSPNADWGYDVADYCAVDPAFGTVADLDALVDAAGRRGIHVILDLVPNHTSIEHPWFVDARSSRDADHRDWYVWADPKPDGSPPNNWVSGFGGPMWTFDATTGQSYMHSHLPEQPDLNWWNEGVRAAFDDILRFWLDRGVAGFRIDVAQILVKDRELRDNPPATDDDDWYARVLGQKPVYNLCRPEVHDVYRHWRVITDGYEPPGLLLGETWVHDVETLATFYGRDDELNLALNFPFVFAKFDADSLSAVVEATERALPSEAWPVWAAGNHDVSRFPTRWAKGEAARARVALLMLLTLRGTPILYYGDEIGMTDVPVGAGDARDFLGRDPERSAMQWEDVDRQRADPASMLNLARDLVALRRESEDLRNGEYRTLVVDGGLWAWRRGDGAVVALNLGPEPATHDAVAGTIAICTNRSRDGETVNGTLTLAPDEALVLFGR
ncbi:MAG: alpha-amylase family glycosyl hydrolase [Acidimicrobiia bacterium]